MVMIIITPLIVMLIFGYSYGGKVTDVKVILVNHDERVGNLSLAEKIIGNLDRETLVLENSSDEEGAKELVKNGRAWAVIIFPQNFTKCITTGKVANRSNVHIFLDGSDPTVASAVIKAVNNASSATMKELNASAKMREEIMKEMSRAVGNASAKMREEINASTATMEVGWSTPISVDVEYAYGGENVKYIDFFAPSIICTVAMALSLMLTIVSFVRERTFGTLDRLLASPFTEGEIVTGYALAFALVSLVQAIILLGVATLTFGISIHGDIFLALGIVVLTSLGFQGLGVMLSVAAKTEFQAAQFMPIVFLPSILLAGVFWPLEAIPSSIRPISYAIPLTYAAKALRSVAVRGWGPERILTELMVLSLFAIMMMFISFLMMKRRR
jgi:ABC-2 type transport system permease protein